MELLDFIYEHFEEFYLLINGAGGSRFASFLDELVQIEVDYTYKYMEVIDVKPSNPAWSRRNFSISLSPRILTACLRWCAIECQRLTRSNISVC